MEKKKKVKIEKRKIINVFFFSNLLYNYFLKQFYF